MTAQNGEGVYGDGAGVVTPIAHKLSQNGPLVKDSTGKPRSGVFYAGNASLVSGKANMSYDVAALEAAISRARTKGTSFPTNDGVVNVATTAAPGSNSRIDVIYFQQQEVSEGDAATQGVVGVAQGTAAASPSAPALPDGAIELARAVVPAGITATTSAVITQTAPFTAPLGATVPFRSTTEMNAWTPLPQQCALDLSSGVVYRYNGSAWTRDDSGLVSIVPTSATGTGVTLGVGGEVSFTAASAVSVDAFSSSDFEEFLILITLDSGSTAGSAVRFRTRTSGGVDSSGANYSDFARTLASATPSYSYAVNATACFIGYVDNTSISKSKIKVEISQPNAVSNTPILAVGVSQDRSIQQEGGNRLNAAYTGFTIYPDSGTITGRLRVYGYSKN